MLVGVLQDEKGEEKEGGRESEYAKAQTSNAFSLLYKIKKIF